LIGLHVSSGKAGTETEGSGERWWSREQCGGARFGPLLGCLFFTKAQFGYADKLAEKHCWLIFYERKSLF
jgi:hypothetical protein